MSQSKFLVAALRHHLCQLCRLSPSAPTHSRSGGMASSSLSRSVSGAKTKSSYVCGIRPCKSSWASCEHVARRLLRRRQHPSRLRRLLYPARVLAAVTAKAQPQLRSCKSARLLCHTHKTRCRCGSGVVTRPSAMTPCSVAQRAPVQTRRSKPPLTHLASRIVTVHAIPPAMMPLRLDCRMGSWLPLLYLVGRRHRQHTTSLAAAPAGPIIRALARRQELVSEWAQVLA